MHTWPVQDAKARFSEFLDACLTEGPQMVTRRGTEAAVLVPIQAWRRLQQAAKPLAMPGSEPIEFEPPRANIRLRPADLS